MLLFGLTSLLVQKLLTNGFFFVLFLHGSVCVCVCCQANKTFCEVKISSSAKSLMNEKLLEMIGSNSGVANIRPVDQNWPARVFNPVHLINFES